MKSYFVAIVLLAGACFLVAPSTADAAPCLIVTLTGTQGGPQSYNGLAGAGTLVR
jgi:ribonuclease Z